MGAGPHKTKITPAILREVRIAKKLTQRQVAKAAGISRQYMTDIEQEKKPIHPGFYQLIQRVLGLPPLDKVKILNVCTKYLRIRNIDLLRCKAAMESGKSVEEMYRNFVEARAMPDHIPPTPYMGF